jgi:hypothetical protein
MSNRTHSDETRKIISEAKKYSKCSDETRKKMSDAKKGKPRPSGSGRSSQVIEVFDLKENATTTYDSIREAARALDIRWKSIKNYFARNQQNPYKGRYTFKKI